MCIVRIRITSKPCAHVSSFVGPTIMDTYTIYISHPHTITARARCRVPKRQERRPTALSTSLTVRAFSAFKSRRKWSRRCVCSNFLSLHFLLYLPNHLQLFSPASSSSSSSSSSSCPFHIYVFNSIVWIAHRNIESRGIVRRRQNIIIIGVWLQPASRFPMYPLYIHWFMVVCPKLAMAVNAKSLSFYFDYGFND